MKKVKRIMSSLFCVMLLFALLSCSPKGTFVVEFSLKRQLVDLSLDEFKEKVNSNDHLIVYVNSPTCKVCQYTKEQFLLDFIKETSLKIYSFQAPSNRVYESEKFIESISPSGASYIKYKEDDIVISVPLILLISEGKVYKYALGYGQKDISSPFFKKNIKLSNKKYSKTIKDEDKLVIEKVEDPSFIFTEEEIDKGIIYYTNDVELNDEMKYYLKPFMEDFNSDIYVKIDPSISNNKLEIKNDDVSFSSSNCDEYLSLLENGTIS